MQVYDWLPTGYRVIPEWDGYIMSPRMDVCSRPRHVTGKGDSTRLLGPRVLKTTKGRVSLSCDGKKQTFNIANDLFPQTFPELVGVRPQPWCHKHHPLMQPLNPEMFGSLADTVTPNVRRWGTGNRICLRCCDPPKTFDTDNRYSREYGITGPADYTTAPATPRPVWRSRHLVDQLLASEHGFIIEKG